MSESSDKQIQAQVSAIRRTLKNGARHVALRFSGTWQGADRLVVDGVEHLVMPCLSDLQMREAMLKAERERKSSILLCDLETEALGDDVINRLAKRRIFMPRPAEVLAELFSVAPSQLDRSILHARELMQALLESVPMEGYPAVPGGTLDLQTAWLTLLRVWMGGGVEAPSLSQFIQWSLEDRKLKVLEGMEEGLQAEFVDWYARSTGEVVRSMLAAVVAGHGKDLLPLGALLGVVFDPQHSRDPEHQRACGALDRFFPERRMDAEGAMAWARASDAVFSRILDHPDPFVWKSHLNRLDVLLGQVQLAERAWISNDSPLGLEQRYQQAGRALMKVLEGGKPESLEAVRAAISRIQKHHLWPSEMERGSRLEMACRLIRWLHVGSNEGKASSLDRMVEDYHREGGFVDWARNRLKETEELPEVQKAYDAILRQVEERRRAFEGEFALQLQEWTREDRRSERFIFMEDALKQVLVPLARQQPVLLLVLDGMSVAVFRQLLQGLLRQDWTEVSHASAGLPRPLLATLPSVTSVSRRALFRGCLDSSTQGTEEGDFQNNQEVYQATGSQVHPRLFKMRDLSEEGTGGIATEVRKAVADAKCRLVSVVINAIDDHLDSGRQVDFEWSRNSIRGLGDLLRQAGEAKRLVVMTSDHGHVLDFGTRELPSLKEGRGDRHRVANGQVMEGELEFEGPRLLKASGHSRLVLACSSSIRYGGKKRGYHGGANPQEMVVPLAVLANVRTPLPEGWAEVPSYTPEWWRLEEVVRIEPAVKAPKMEKAVQGLELFEQAGKRVAAVSGGWIPGLLASPVYEEQSKLAVRGAPSDELMTRLLEALETRGGSALKQALAQELGQPLFRVDGLIENVARILNVDGYPVLVFDRSTDTVVLNIKLLRTQFDLKES